MEINCSYCGKKFDTILSKIKKNKQLFCSLRCYHNSLKKNNFIFIKGDSAYVQLNSRKGDKYFAIIDVEDLNKISGYHWHLHCNKYVRSTEKIMLHRLIMNCPDNRVVDHINHDTLDNRKQNLRICTSFGNCQNIITNTSGKPGVCKDKYHGWYSSIKIGGKKRYLGHFKTFEEAKFAREQAEIKYDKYEV